jgi:hypothetical protein
MDIVSPNLLLLHPDPVCGTHIDSELILDLATRWRREGASVAMPCDGVVDRIEGRELVASVAIRSTSGETNALDT